MEDPVLMTLGIIVGVVLLYLGGRIRRRSLRRARPPEDPGRERPE